MKGLALSFLVIFAPFPAIKKALHMEVSFALSGEL